MAAIGYNDYRELFDSLNPSAIAQQMLLQAMVKQKRHTLYFILGIGTANLAMGLAVYYGIAAWASVLLEKLVSAYPQHMYGAAVAVGLLCLAVGIRLVVEKRRAIRNAPRRKRDESARPALAACAVRNGRRFLRRGIDERVPVFRLYRNAIGLCAAVPACSAFYTSV